MLSRARSRWGADRMFSGVIGAFLVLSWVKVCSGQLGDHQKIYLEVNNTRGALCTSPRLDIVFIIDESRSIWEPDFKKQLQFLSRVTEDLTIGPDDIQIGALTFATYTTDHFYLNTYKTQKNVQRALSYIRQLNTGRTNTHLAIQRVREKYFLPEKGARKNVPKVAIVITDGESREPKDTAREAAQARTEGILMIAIGVGRKFSLKELNAIASNRPGIMGKLVFTVEEYGALDEVRFEIAKVMCSGQESQALSDVASTWGAWSQWTECSKTCGGGTRGRSRFCEGITERCEGTAEDVEPCNPTPCAEWTTWSPWSPCPVTCGQGQAVRRRKCQNGAPGVDCEGLEIEGKTCLNINCRKPGDPCQTQKIDLVFVVDESTSIWQPNFMKQLKFLSRITEDFEIGQNATQIGVLTFATNARDQFYLNKYQTGKEVREAIKKIVQPDTFSTNTHKAIHLMRMDYFLSKNGDRPDVPNVAVVITDGKSRNQLATKKEAAGAKNQGITMVAVGIGKQYSLNELRNIASDHVEMPGEKMVFTVENYDTLADLKEQISRIVCPDKPISQPGWGKWTMCSKTCDGGIRTRRCDGAVEQCRGRAQEIQPCNTNPCPNWAPWYPWGTCSATCGVGLQVRTRYCIAGVSGVDCLGDAQERRSCNTTKNCASWTTWTQWSECSETCDEGFQLRTRVCEGGAPGEDCPGISEEGRKCNLKQCPFWVSWGEWGDCSATCGNGTQSRRRRCSGGFPGKDCLGDPEDSRQCILTQCPFWNPWSTWSECSATCGSDGFQSRTRVCNDSTGAGCDGESEEGQQCNNKSCPTWDSWAPWSDCSESCGDGSQTRTRLCTDGIPGVDCIGDGEEIQECRVKPCPTWDSWAPWTDCSVTCGSGLQSRTRLCKDGVPSVDCPGAGKEEQECNIIPCPIWGSWTPWTECSVTCGSGTQSRERLCIDGAPGVDCLGEQDEERECHIIQCPSWASWTSWSECSATCGDGFQSKTRQCEGGVAGVDCVGESEEGRKCNVKFCVMPTEASWANWGEWSACSATCGRSFKARSRVCDGGAPGVDCTGTSEEGAHCFSKPCPSWVSWSQWSSCTVTCGGGLQMRTRLCDFGISGVDCTGAAEDKRACATTECASWATWNAWGACSATCGYGNRARTRTCTGGAPGVDCKGGDIERRTCTVGQCSSWTTWNRWEPCSVSCGRGIQTRTRTCLPGVGGMECTGLREQNRGCDSGQCPEIPAPLPRDARDDVCCSDLEEADIVFVSDSVGFGGVRANKALKFVEDVISDLPIDSGRVQAALVSSECLSKMGFYLNTYKERNEMTSYLHNLPVDEVVPPMIASMRKKYFSPEHGARPNVRRIGVILLDDDAKFSYDAMDEIMASKAENIELFAVSFSKNINNFKMKFIADDPKSAHMFKTVLGTREELHELRKELSGSICKRLRKR